MRELIDGTRPRRAAPSLQELRAYRDEIAAICAQNGVSDLKVVGSVARGEQDADSDVDFLCDIEKGRSLFDLVRLVRELEDLLGCPVNVVDAATLDEDGFSTRVRRDAVPL